MMSVCEEVPDVRERGRAWISLIAACLGSFVHYSAYSMTGVIYVALLDHYKDDPVKTSLVGSIYSAMLCVLGPAVSILINKYSCRSVAVAGGLVLAIGSFVSAFVPSIDWLIVTFGIIAGAGGALTNTPMNVVIGYCFTTKRDILLSVHSATMGLGMFVATPLGLHLLGQYGLQGTFIMLSGIYLNLCVFGLLLKPSAIELRIKKQRRLADMDKPTVSSNEGLFERCLEGIRTKSAVFIDAPFVLFLFGTLSWNVFLSVCIMHLPNYMTSRGDSEGHIASVMVCFGVSSIIGRLSSAVSLAYSHKLDTFILNAIVLGVLGVVTITFPLYKFLANSEYVFVCLAASLAGFPNALMSPLNMRLMGVANFSVAFGVALFAAGIGFTTGPPIASALFKRTGSYDSSFIFAGVISLAGCCCVLASFIIHKQRNPLTPKKQQQQQQKLELTIELINRTEKQPGGT